MKRAIDDPESLTDRDVARIRLLLARCISRRGVPQSSECREIREHQSEQVRGPMHHEVAQVVVSRLEPYPQDSGIEEFEPVVQPVSETEAERFQIEASAAIPESVRRKVQRCLVDTADALIERGIIMSGETLARVLPQVTSGLRAAGITDPTLRQLYASIYRAFRRRRSLLLLNLESQVRIEELPWVAAIDQFRREDSLDPRTGEGDLAGDHGSDGHRVSLCHPSEQAPARNASLGQRGRPRFAARR